MDDGTVGYQVDKITEKIAEEASQFVNSESFINDNSWWLNWAYTNGTMAEKDYDDVTGMVVKYNTESPFGFNVIARRGFDWQR